MRDAALAAGYSPSDPASAGYQAQKSIQRKAPDLFTRHGLDDDSFIQNHLLPALNATETKVFHTGKKIVYSKPMVNWTARTTTNRLVAEIKGMIVKEQDTPKPPVRILVIDSSTRPPVNSKPKVLDVPESTTAGLEPPKITSSTPAYTGHNGIESHHQPTSQD